jgi:hypothetical protein
MTKNKRRTTISEWHEPKKRVTLTFFSFWSDNQLYSTPHPTKRFGSGCGKVRRCAAGRYSSQLELLPTWVDGMFVKHIIKQKNNKTDKTDQCYVLELNKTKQNGQNWPVWCIGLCRWLLQGLHRGPRYDLELYLDVSTECEQLWAWLCMCARAHVCACKWIPARCQVVHLEVSLIADVAHEANTIHSTWSNHTLCAHVHVLPYKHKVCTCSKSHPRGRNCTLFHTSLWGMHCR